MIDPNGSAVRSTLVLGGARSGKSRHAQELAEATDGRLVFVATAQPFDDEMADRIARHRADRDARWTTVEAPVALAEAIDRCSSPDATVLVDCLTLWASNLLVGGHAIEPHRAALLSSLAAFRGRLILVSNEVGMGIVPDNALAREFRDVAGILNQRIAAAVDRVRFIAAGLALDLK